MHEKYQYNRLDATQLKVKIKMMKERAEEKDKKWMTEQVKKEIKKKKELNR